MGGSLSFQTRILQFRVFFVFFGKKENNSFRPFFFLVLTFESALLWGAQRAGTTHKEREREKKKKKKHGAHTPFSFLFPFFSASFRRVEDEKGRFCTKKKRDPLFFSSAFLI